MSVGDIYELTAKGTLDGQLCENVFHYSVSVDPADASSSDQIIGLLETNVLDLTAVLVSDQFTWTSVAAKNIMSVSDFDELPYVNPGLVSGDYMPTFVAFGFILKRALRLCNNGRKAFAGVPESSVVDGVVTDTGILGDLGLLAAGLGATVSGGGVTYEPVIYRKPSPDHVNGLSFATNGALYKRVTTQNSRKIGRGI